MRRNLTLWEGNKARIGTNERFKSRLVLGQAICELTKGKDNAAPTIADLVGISSVKGFHGRSLLPVMRGSQRATEGTIATRQVPEFRQRLISYRTPEWKYICTESLDEANTVLSEEVYDLRNDPQERHNLHGSEAEAARAFELEAVSKILELKRLKSGEKTAYEKERIRARLKKLGKL